MMRSWMIMTLSGQREQFGQSCVKTTRKSLSVTLDALHCSLYFSVLLAVLHYRTTKLNVLFSFQCYCFHTCSWRFYEITKLNALHCPLSSVCFLAYFKQSCFQWWLWLSSTLFTAVLFTYSCASLLFAVGAKHSNNQTKRSVLFCFIFLFCNFLFEVLCTLVPLLYTSITQNDHR